MKIPVMILICAFVSTATFAGQDLAESAVPPAVLAAFKAAHPNATHIDYEKETEAGAIRYEIEFREDGKKIEIDYAADGAILKTEQDD
jgi:hypothetical protein